MNAVPEKFPLPVVAAACYERDMTSLEELPRIGAPATRALAAAGITSLRQLAGRSRVEIAGLHGMGPKALGTLTAALTEHGLGLT